MKLEQERQKQQKEEQKIILGKGKSRPRLSFTLKATEWFLLSSFLLLSSLDVCFMLKWIGGSVKERSALSTQLLSRKPDEEKLLESSRFKTGLAGTTIDSQIIFLYQYISGIFETGYIFRNSFLL